MKQKLSVITALFIVGAFLFVCTSSAIPPMPSSSGTTYDGTGVNITATTANITTLTATSSNTTGTATANVLNVTTGTFATANITGTTTANVLNATTFTATTSNTTGTGTANVLNITTLTSATAKFTTGAAAGYIFVSDADGDGTWTAGTTDASSNSTAIYKASDGSIASWTTSIDGHANATLTLYPGICPIVHNTSQADANVTITLPSVASGLCFTALVVTTEDDKTWRFNSAAANTICLGATCAKDDIGFATGQNTKGGLFKCIAQGTEWFCHTITGTVDAGDL